MIEVSETTLLLIYFFLWLGVIVYLWIREVVRRHRDSWELSNDMILHCEECHHTFLSQYNYARCPACNKLCFKGKHRGL